MLKRFSLFLIIIFTAGISGTIYSQSVHKQLIQFSGVVVDKNSLKRLPYVAMMISNSSHGTVSDNNGYFSFVAQPSDTIEFAAIGYKENTFIIPDTLTDRFALIHLMDKDTAVLNAVVVYPWPSKEAFRDAFLNLNLANNDLDRAKKNLAISEVKAKMQGMPMDAQANFMNSMQQEYNKLYYAGQYPTNNLLNPLAWANFIQAWKDGSLKIQ